MHKIWYIMQKEFRQIFREKTNIVIIFVLPFIQLVLLGFAITTDVTNISTMIVDQDHSQLSRRMIDAFSTTKTFTCTAVGNSIHAAIAKMDRGQIKLIVVIPPHFQRDVKMGSVPNIQLILDGVDGNSAGISNGYAARALLTLQREWLNELPSVLRKKLSLHLITVQPRMLYNPELKSQNNMVPGILVLLLTMITMFLTTINVVREKEMGTMEQVLVTPVTSFELIVGKVLPFAILGFALFNVGLLAAGLIFGIWLKGNLLLLYALSLVYMLTTLGLGIFISTIAASQQQAMFFAWFFSIFAILLSGFFVPIENMPGWVQAITCLNPTRYFMIVVRGIVLKGAGLTALWSELGMMSLLGVVILGSAIAKFQKRLQ
jgi:ABC-2 type transport system permease protein